jgi:hypothetical protein
MQTNRVVVLGAVLLGLLATESRSWGQAQTNRPKGILPGLWVPILEKDTFGCSFVLGCPSVQTDLPLAGFYGSVYIGSTPIGAFGASIDLQVTLKSWGPGVSLHWFPYESLVHTLRLDLFRGGVASDTTWELDLGHDINQTLNGQRNRLKPEVPMGR